MVNYISGSHYSGGSVPPANTAVTSDWIVDNEYIELDKAKFTSRIQSGGYRGYGDPVDNVDYYRLTPGGLGDGLTVGVDLSGVTGTTTGFQIGVYDHAPPYDPGGTAPGGADTHQAWATIIGGAWEFAWAGWRWTDEDDPHWLISPQGVVRGAYDPASMRYLSICFDGSASAGGYWALKVGDTLSALHIPAGMMPTLPTGAPGIVNVPHLARTHHPIWMEDFIVWAEVEAGVVKMPYWDVESQPVTLPVSYTWAIAKADGTWFSTDNYAARDSGWAVTYPVRLS